MIEGFASALVCLLIVGPVTGQIAVAIDLLRTLPLYLLMAVSGALAGAAAASTAVGKRADVLVGNTFAYLVLVTGGVFVPPDHIGWFGTAGSILPIHNGLIAVRAVIGGQPWVGSALREIAVGLGWAALAVCAYAWQSARSRATGIDDFA